MKCLLFYTALPGRLRVKLADIKRAPAVARKLEERLQREPGVAEAVANPVTGSVLVHYDPRRTSSQTILARLAPYGLSTPAPSAPSRLTGLPSQISLPYILLGVISSIGIGLFFGIYPANRAAKLDPVRAMSYAK